jgi:hypothetical protein
MAQNQILNLNDCSNALEQDFSKALLDYGMRADAVNQGRLQDTFKVVARCFPSGQQLFWCSVSLT